MADFIDKTWEKYKDKIDETMEDTTIDGVMEDPTNKTADESQQEAAVDDNEEDTTAEPSLPPGWQRWNNGLISPAGVKFPRHPAPGRRRRLAHRPPPQGPLHGRT